MSTRRIPRKPAPSSAQSALKEDVAEQHDNIDIAGVDDKGASTVAVKENQLEVPPEPHHHPRTGKFPFLGIGALLLVFICLIGCIMVLVMSNRKPVSAWDVQPTVLLALFSAVSNSAIAFAFTEGITLSWWNRARRGSTLKDLHQHWKQGTSVWACLADFKLFNLVAFTSVLTTLVVVDGPLWQRASSVVSRSFDGPISIEALITPVIPTGYTAYISGRDEYPDRLTPSFIPVTQEYLNRVPITSGLKGCTGQCAVNVPAAGFAVSCSSSSIPINYTAVSENGTYSLDSFNTNPAFSVIIDWGPGSTEIGRSSLLLNVSYAVTQSCAGMIVSNSCILRSATVLHHVLLNENIVTLGPTLTNLSVLALANNTGYGETFQTFSTLGGISIAANDLFQTNTSIRFNGVGEYQPFGLSTFASGYLGNDSVISSCQINWLDPTNDIIAALQELMFRTALHAANASDYAPYTSGAPGNNFPIKQTLQGTLLGTQNVFKTHYAFGAAAAGVMVLGLLAVLPHFHQFWKLGRPVTFSPIDIAKAFDAPLLSDTAPQDGGGVEALVMIVGERRVIL